MQNHTTAGWVFSWLSVRWERKPLWHFLEQNATTDTLPKETALDDAETCWNLWVSDPDWLRWSSLFVLPRCLRLRLHLRCDPASPMHWNAAESKFAKSRSHGLHFISVASSLLAFYFRDAEMIPECWHQHLTRSGSRSSRRRWKAGHLKSGIIKQCHCPAEKNLQIKPSTLKYLNIQYLNWHDLELESPSLVQCHKVIKQTMCASSSQRPPAKLANLWSA